MGHARSTAVSSTASDDEQRNFFVGISSFRSEVLQGRRVHFARNTATATATCQFRISAGNGATSDGSLIE